MQELSPTTRYTAAMMNLRSAIHWRAISIGGDAASNYSLHLGEAGDSGPLALICAGIHGDEGPWGTAAISQLLDSTPRDDLLGRLRILPVANPNALAHEARCAPLDSLDLNRLFPGNANGFHSERLAALITAEALPEAEFVIDIHGGGSWCVNQFMHQDAGETALSTSFGAPFASRMPDHPGMLGNCAKSQGAQVTGLEIGGRGARENEFIAQVAAGLRRALGRVGVLTPLPEDDAPPPPQLIEEMQVLRPLRGGVLKPALGVEAVGTLVPKGTLLGELLHPATSATLQRFEATYEPTALLLLRPHLTALEAGAMTYAVGRIS